MRGGWSNDEKGRGHSEQNERAKLSTTWLHYFPLRQERRNVP